MRTTMSIPRSQTSKAITVRTKMIKRAIVLVWRMTWMAAEID